MLTFFKQLAEKYTTPVNLTPADGIKYWQERLLLLILFSVVIIGFFVLIPNVWFSLQSGFWGIAILDIFVYILGIVTLLFRSLPYRIRAIFCIFIFLSLGIVLSLVLGPFSPGVIWLFMAPVITVLLMDMRSSFIVLGLNLLTLIGIGVIIYLEILDIKLWPFAIPTSQPIYEWTALVLNFLLLNLITILSTSFVFKGLHGTLVQEQALADSFKQNVKELAQSNELLQSEVSERMEAQKALHESEENYRMLVTQMNEGVIILDQDFKITFVNPAIVHIFGFTEEELLHKPALPFLNTENREKIEQDSQSGVVHRPGSQEVLLTKKNGEQIHMLASTGPLTSDSSSEGLIVILTDVSKLKSIESSLQEHKENLEEKVEQRTHELEEAKIQAESANQAKSEFLANISHELRTPMHHILNYSKFGITKTGNVPLEKLVHYFSQIRKTGERLMFLLNDLLDLSKLEAGKTDYQMKVTDLSLLIKEAATDFNVALSEKQITMRIEDPAFETTSLCDPLKIGQVVRNLMSNAIKYSPEKEIISVRFGQNSLQKSMPNIPGLEIMVIDKGVGIPETELDLIFDKFSQSSKTKDGSGGTGLGLSISKQIISDHRGEIWAESKVEKGTIIHFTLPLADNYTF